MPARSASHSVRAESRISRARAVLTATAVLGAGASSAIVIARGIEAARSGFHDPSLAARMGSEAIKFPIQLAYVVPVAALLASIAFIAGRRAIELQALACAALAAISTFLFFRWAIVDCAVGRPRENAFDFTVLGAALGLSSVLGFIVGRRRVSWAAMAGACLPLIATMVVIAHVQMWHCAPSSQQIGREFIAPMAGIMVAGPLILALATVAWWLGRRTLRTSGPQVQESA